MRKILLLFVLLLCSVTYMVAEPVITLTTSKEYGETFKFNPVPLEEGTIKVDWGDGNLESYEMSPTDMPYMLRKEHKLMGSTIKIYGKLSELTCSDQKITSVKIEEQSGLVKLSLNHNLLTHESIDLGDAKGLTFLNLAENQIGMLNLRNFSSLQYLDLYGNHELTTVAFADSNPNMKTITLYDTDLIHFYDEYDFPNLGVLDLHNTSLTEVTFNPLHYPKLATLKLDNNRLTDLDVSGLLTLEKLSVANNQLSTLNVAANVELTELSISGNKGIKKLNLANNSKLMSLNVSCTSLDKLDVRHMSKLLSLYVDSLNLKTLDVSDLMYLSTLSAKACQLSYLDFTANYFNLKYLYLQGNKNFTAQSLNFMYNTIHNPNKTGRIYVNGCTGAEKADATKYLNLDDYDSNWNIDIEGDGSASMTPVQLTLLPAEGGTYQVYRRDFSSNVSSVWTKNYEEATDGKVVPGFVNVIRFVPEEGKSYKGVKINGTLVKDSLFFVTEDAEIEAVFGEGTDDSDEKYITFSVYPGQDSQYGFGADQPNTEIYIDWGDGNLVKGVINNDKFTYFDGQTEGQKVTVYGDVSYINVESYPYGYGVDNRIKGIDLSHNNGIHQLNAYCNELKSIDVSNQPELYVLDISMNEDIENLDVTNNPELVELTAYTTSIEELDLSKNTQLQYLDVKNCMLETLNVENNQKLVVLSANNNYLEEINVSKLPELDILLVSGNELGALDLTNNVKMRELAADKNKLETLNLQKNVKLEKLSVSNNQLDGLDLSNNTEIWYVDARANGWDACTVNDFYNLLPKYISPGEEAEETVTGTKLWIAGENSSTGRANDVQHSETVILSGKDWITNINEDGDGTGCDRSYVYILSSENGAIKLFNDKNQEVLSGTTVKKGTEVSVVVEPELEYTLKALKANGVDIKDNKFTVTRVTDVAAKFELASTGVDGVSRILATAEGGNHEIRIVSDEDVEVSVVSLSGKTCYQTVVKGATAIGIPAGIYTVTLKQNGQTATKKLLVK